jgi:Rod binding domain-containing protein
LTEAARAKAAKLTGSALRNAAPAEQRAAAAAQFEAILVRQLLGKTMTSMLGGSSGGVAGSIYGDMLSDTISQQLTSGKGLGLGRFLEQQLAPRHSTAPAADGVATNASTQASS